MFAVNRLRLLFNGQPDEISSADSHVLEARASPHPTGSQRLELKDGGPQVTRSRNVDGESGYGEDSSDPIVVSNHTFWRRLYNLHI